MARRSWPVIPSSEITPEWAYLNRRQFMKGMYPAIIDKITQTHELTADDEKALSAAIEDFKATGTY